MTSRGNWIWPSAATVLLVIVVLGIVIAWSRYRDAAMVEISLAQAQSGDGEMVQGSFIAISGNVSTPGLYPLAAGDTVADLIRAAGGPAGGVTAADVTLELRYGGGSEGAQRININRADVWLLEALPGIGETLAKRIVDYRRQNGAFRSVSDLKSVSGLGEATYETIKGMVTVSD